MAGSSIAGPNRGDNAGSDIAGEPDAATLLAHFGEDSLNVARAIRRR
jgi:hypothetical protein